MRRFYLQCLVATLFLTTCCEEEVNEPVKASDEFFVWASIFYDLQAERIETIPGDPYFVLRMSTCSDQDPKSDTYCENYTSGQQLFIYIETDQIKAGATIKLANGVPQPFDPIGNGTKPSEGSYARIDDPSPGDYYFVSGEIVISDVVDNKAFGNFTFDGQWGGRITGVFKGMPLYPNVMYTGGNQYPLYGDPIPCEQLADHAITSFNAPWKKIRTNNTGGTFMVELTNCLEDLENPGLCPNIKELHYLTLYLETDKMKPGATVQLRRGESPPNGATISQYPVHGQGVSGSFATYAYSENQPGDLKLYYYQWGTMVISNIDNNKLTATINMIGLDANNSTETFADTVSLSDIPISTSDFYPLSVSDIYCLE